MKLSELISEMRKAMAAHGDLPVTNDRDFIREVRVTPARDSVVNHVDPNELHLELMEY